MTHNLREKVTLDFLINFMLIIIFTNLCLI